MRSAVLRQGRIVVRDDVDDPSPGPGQLLIEVLACGICGSDLHFVHHGATMLELGRRMEGAVDVGRVPPDLSRDVFMGHEFSGRVLDAGPRAEGPAAGSVVTSLPAIVTSAGVQDLVYSNDHPCGYGERMVLSAALAVEVPNGLDPRHAALTEPMAVGLHAVNRSGIEPGAGAVVVGCGPVGLAVVAALAVRGVAPIVASDPSPMRRSLAVAMGAHEVVDPGVEQPFTVWRRAAGGRPVVAFEAVGVPGVLDELLRVTPALGRIVVVGVCMQPDTITPFFGIGKELDVRFALGYDPTEFAASLHSIAGGEIDVAPLVTGEVDLDGLAAAFDRLATPAEDCKVLVVPGRRADRATSATAPPLPTAS